MTGRGTDVSERAEIELEVSGGVALITIAAPAKRNALDRNMAAQLVAVCDAVDSNAAIGAAVVRGADGHFCSGARRELLAEAGRDPAGEGYEATGAIYQAFQRVGVLGVPTIAAVRGAAVGAGVNLMLATDLRVVANDARIIAGFLSIGLHPGGGHFALMGRLAGRETAAAAALFSEELSGSRAAELGLAWSTVPDADVESTAMRLAAVAARDPLLSRVATQSFRLALGPPALPWEAALFAERAPQMWSLRRRSEREAASMEPQDTSNE